MEHTPLPWKAEREESSGNDKLWGDTDCVGIIYQQGLPDSANADFIVRAVNSHYKLLKALERLIPEAKNGLLSMKANRGRDSVAINLEDAIEFAHVAIEEARK